MKLRVSSRAQRETDRIDAWWRKNRPAAPTLFLREMVYVVELLLHSPTLGTAYEAEHFDGPVRRVLLERSACHLFYGQLGDELSSFAFGALAESAARSCSVFPLAAQKEGS